MPLNCSERNWAPVLSFSLDSLAGRVASDPVCHHLAVCSYLKAAPSIYLTNLIERPVWLAAVAVTGIETHGLTIKAVAGCGGHRWLLFFIVY